MNKISKGLTRIKCFIFDDFGAVFLVPGTILVIWIVYIVTAIFNPSFRSEFVYPENEFKQMEKSITKVMDEGIPSNFEYYTKNNLKVDYDEKKDILIVTMTTDKIFEDVSVSAKVNHFLDGSKEYTISRNYSKGEHTFAMIFIWILVVPLLLGVLVMFICLMSALVVDFIKEERYYLKNK